MVERAHVMLQNDTWGAAGGGTEHRARGAAPPRHSAGAAHGLNAMHA